ncbi:diadenylate cyclase CdaA [Acutalibacter caecimuris]|uniref:diadenylate cyclase CdaA n=1 Tax=Acutalibacter caecimuris TaxID=3093657 RepID=UPI002AC8B811|nr:diadenylate cyclase CdaA [Acutalibacter sp. M00118]
MENITRMGQTVLNLARQFTLKDALDVAIVTILLYGLIKLVRDTRAGQLMKGVILLVALFLISDYGQLLVLNGILKAFLQSAFVMVVILFQPEIRKALEQMGRSKVAQSLTNAVGARGKTAQRTETRQAIAGVVEATAILQQLRMGALIVFERHTRLGEIISTGTLVDAGPSGQLIANIFFNKAPLHDGGMVIREGRICAAGCILPLTASDAVSAELGTRHRAALGMSENSDAVVVVVSEETGQISLAMGGRLTRNYNRMTLAETLESELVGQPEGVTTGGLLGRLGLGRDKDGQDDR